MSDHEQLRFRNALNELKQFLDPGTRMDVLNSALGLLLSLSADGNFYGAISIEDATDLCKLLANLFTNNTLLPSSRALLFSLFVNMTADNETKEFASVFLNDNKFIEVSLKEMFNESNDQICTIRAIQILSNLSRHFPGRLSERISSTDPDFILKAIGKWIYWFHWYGIILYIDFFLARGNAVSSKYFGIFRFLNNFANHRIPVNQSFHGSCCQLANCKKQIGFIYYVAFSKCKFSGKNGCFRDRLQSLHARWYGHNFYSKIGCELLLPPPKSVARALRAFNDFRGFTAVLAGQQFLLWVERIKHIPLQCFDTLLFHLAAIPQHKVKPVQLTSPFPPVCHSPHRHQITLGWPTLCPFYGFSRLAPGKQS